jgi:magnesium transporter
MNDIMKKRSKKKGLPPGTLIHIGEKKADKTKITIFDYNSESFEEKQIHSVDKCVPYKDKPSVTWINLDGLHEVETLENFGNAFGLHHLLLEDILNTDQRPKVESYDDYLYIVLKMLQYDNRENKLDSEQISLVLGENYVISFQEKEGDVFDPIRDRIRLNKGRVRKMNSDYLLYCLLDCVVDNYFIILENISEQIENIENELVSSPSENILHNIHKLKRTILYLRKSVWPLRELINNLQREETLISENISPYLRDLYDHVIQVIDTIETFREMLSGMLDIYLSSISNRMNTVMKVLTMISTIFIPLTFIAGIYGMNFKFMPELEWHWGYPGILILMFSIFLVMMYYFKRKDWL